MCSHSSKEDMAAQFHIVRLSRQEARHYRSMTVMAQGYSCSGVESNARSGPGTHMDDFGVIKHYDLQFAFDLSEAHSSTASNVKPAYKLPNNPDDDPNSHDEEHDSQRHRPHPGNQRTLPASAVGKRSSRYGKV